MSKSKEQSSSANTQKMFIVFGVTIALLLLNVIPFTYSRTVTCMNNNPSIPSYQHEIKQEVRRLGVPFAYWWQNSEECEGGSAMDANLTHVSGTALFWDLALIGMITVGLSYLINPSTKKAAA